MEVEGKVAIVTGGASGIGRAIARRLATENLTGITVVDLNGAGAQEVADEIGGLGLACDVASEADIQAAVAATESRFGPVDLFFSNAGIGIGGGVEASNEDWQKIWDINVMAHVFAARAVIPSMIERGGGYLINTASAAGLLSQIGSTPYAVTKHAAVGLAENLAITYGDDGIRVSVLCPQAVRTGMTQRGGRGGVAAVDGLLEPEPVADLVLEAIREERFLILPHPEVQTYMERKVTDYDRWLHGMRRLQQRFRAGDPLKG